TGEGRVVRVSPLLLVDRPPYDGKPDTAIQTASSIRGTALRDALPFIEFSQFMNQLEFARVANELNARAGKAIPQVAGGQTITFAGISVKSAAGELPEIIPVDVAVRS